MRCRRGIYHRMWLVECHINAVFVCVCVCVSSWTQEAMNNLNQTRSVIERGRNRLVEIVGAFLTTAFVLFLLYSANKFYDEEISSRHRCENYNSSNVTVCL